MCWCFFTAYVTHTVKNIYLSPGMASLNLLLPEYGSLVLCNHGPKDLHLCIRIRSLTYCLGSHQDRILLSLDRCLLPFSGSNLPSYCSTLVPSAQSRRTRCHQNPRWSQLVTEIHIKCSYRMYGFKFWYDNCSMKNRTSLPLYALRKAPFIWRLLFSEYERGWTMNS